MVYTKLNPYVVMLHFLASMVLVGVAVVLVHRCSRDYRPGTGTLLVPRPSCCSRERLAGLLALVLAAGTATTGAGPHAGASQGQLVAQADPGRAA